MFGSGKDTDSITGLSWCEATQTRVRNWIVLNVKLKLDLKSWESQEGKERTKPERIRLSRQKDW